MPGVPVTAEAVCLKTVHLVAAGKPGNTEFLENTGTIDGHQGVGFIREPPD